MNILHITSVSWPATEWGGPVRSVAALVRGQRELGHDVMVLTTNSRGTPGLPPHPTGQFTIDGQVVVYHRARFSNRYAFSTSLAADARRLAADADIVHLHGLWSWPTAAGSSACRSRGVPYVLSPRGMLLNWAMSQKSFKKKLYRFVVQNRILLSAVALHCTSDQEKQEIPERYRHIPSVVLPNPIEMDDLLQVRDADYTTAPYRLLMCGRIHPVKGFDQLIPALAAVRRSGLDIRLAVAGGDEGGYRGEVERLAREHQVSDVVEFLDNLDRDALVEAYDRAAVLVMPSYQENFGMSAAEAMAAARPVIVSRGVNIAENIESAGAGLVVGQNSAEIAGAILELAGNPARSRIMAGNGRRFASERYAPRKIAAAMIDAYSQILEG